MVGGAADIMWGLYLYKVGRYDLYCMYVVTARL
jgi:hypothetical protein